MWRGILDKDRLNRLEDFVIITSKDDERQKYNNSGGGDKLRVRKSKELK